MTTRRLAMMALFCLGGLFTQEASAWYSPQLGRWLTRDPIGYLGATDNLYEYVGSDPINLADPEGKQAELVLPITPGLAPIAGGAGAAAAAAAPVVGAAAACGAAGGAGYGFGSLIAPYTTVPLTKCYCNWYYSGPTDDAKDETRPIPPDNRCEYYLSWCLWGKENSGKGKGWGKNSDCYGCYSECKATGGIWSFGKCPLGNRGPRWRGDDDSVWPPGHPRAGN